MYVVMHSNPAADGTPPCGTFECALAVLEIEATRLRAPRGWDIVNTDRVDEDNPNGLTDDEEQQLADTLAMLRAAFEPQDTIERLRLSARASRAVAEYELANAQENHASAIEKGYRGQALLAATSNRGTYE